MKMIDFHCDTLLEIHKSGHTKQLIHNDLHVDIQKLKQAESYAQFFAIFIDSKEIKAEGEDEWIRFMEMHSIFAKEMVTNKNDICLATNYNELKHNEKEGKISAFLTIEDGGLLENQHDRLQTVYDMGVRLITLTWNYPNCIGCPNGDTYKNLGLTPFGKEVVEKMNSLGMLVDVSHLSDQGFYDVANLSKSPFIASHSNARAIRNHGRNLTDDMLKLIGDTGSVVGLNYCPLFLNDIPYSSAKSIVEHAKYMVNIAGEEAVSLGSDFDGIGGELEIRNIGEIDKLYTEFKNQGFSENLIEKIWYKNAERVIKEVLK